MDSGATIEAVNVKQRSVPALDEQLHDNALVHRVLAARGVQHAHELACSLASLPTPERLPDIGMAVERLLTARDAGEKILIVGDYDCDGATSTTVALHGLRMLGFEQLDYIVPNRFDFGYGLSATVVDLAYREFDPHVLLTVDNGVASVEGVAKANESGIDVVVTDHHLAPQQLPDAIAIVNPNLPGSEFAGRNLAGVGVIFYVLLAVRAELKRRKDRFAKAALADLLDLVAIGTVADVVPLDAVNRTLVEQGLKRMRAGHTRPGVQALLQVAGKSQENMTTQDIGFGIGPRLNAAGRLADMRVGVECLLSDSSSDALRLANELNGFNKSRQGIEADMQRDALAQLDSLFSASGGELFGVCLHDDEWHQGVIGILAGRIKEKIYRPTIVFTADDDEHLKGSARSVSDVHIRDVLQDIAATHPGMLSKFGGHAMAAGLSLKRTQLDDFRQAFNNVVKKVQQGKPGMREYLTDGGLSTVERTLDNAQLLARILPWGQKFEPPLFCDTFRLVAQKVVGNGHLQMTLETVDSDQNLKAIAFNREPVDNVGEQFTMVYSLEPNYFRQSWSLQLRIEHLEPPSLR